ncbi:MAG: GspH/FimT family pseudopilin [Deltaproteobacteria bacterium]|nr:GspH/FimT family pseudopilin [Deltaproteobacteria bacterium]MBW2319028.1 GspH/FimT family pseudopilin [Deltaproteobacteria bacterium]MBW2602305.1 GspH/FimT family pseudopilin [Deltaproteobacteria bacterium]
MNYIHNNNSEGFTLLEITIVIAIAGILAAIAVPSLVSQLPRYRLSGAARQVMGDLMWARMQAVNEKNEFRIFIIDSHRYQILDDDDNNGSVGSGEKVQVKDIRDEYPDVSISNTTNPIFFPRGSASMGTITLSNSSGSRKLKIHLTGRVKMV